MEDAKAVQSMTENKPHWLVAYSDPRVSILQAEDNTLAVYRVPWKLRAALLSDPDGGNGLWIWEGVHNPKAIIADYMWEGSWRRLTDDELARLSRGEAVRE